MAPLLWSIRIPTWLAMVWRKGLAAGTRTTSACAGPRSIIVFRLDQLGDVVLTTPLFRELKRLYPRARCTIVVRPEYKAILTTNRNIDEILTLAELKAQWLPAGARWLMSVLWFYWIELRHRHFDMAISPRWDSDESLATLLCVLTHASKRVGYGTRVSLVKQKLNRGFDAAFDVVVPSGPLRHELDRNLAIVEALGGKATSSRLEIRLSDSDRTFADELFTQHGPRRVLVAIGIGGRAASRRWPLERYAETIARLNRDQPVQPVILCSDEEDAKASELSVMLQVPPYILSGVPLRAVCAVLEKCDLFLGNDTGTAHLAAAMDCPTLVISRHPANGDPGHANSPARFGPRSARPRVLQPLSGAGACLQFCRSKEAHCILQVTVDRVVAAALELLFERRKASADKMPAAFDGVAVHAVDDLQPTREMVSG
jgi:heptosyltransferase-2